jgi:hypothetical protein
MRKHVTSAKANEVGGTLGRTKSHAVRANAHGRQAEQDR